MKALVHNSFLVSHILLYYFRIQHCSLYQSTVINFCSVWILKLSWAFLNDVLHLQCLQFLFILMYIFFMQETPICYQPTILNINIVWNIYFSFFQNCWWYFNTNNLETFVLATLRAVHNTVKNYIKAQHSKEKK